MFLCNTRITLNCIKEALNPLPTKPIFIRLKTILNLKNLNPILASSLSKTLCNIVQLAACYKYYTLVYVHGQVKHS